MSETNNEVKKDHAKTWDEAFSELKGFIMAAKKEEAVKAKENEEVNKVSDK